MLPALIGLIALFVGIAIGGADNSSTSADPEVTTETVVTTITPDPVTTTEIKTLRPPAPTATVTRTVRVTPQPEAGITGDGTFIVGTQVQPGTYQSSGGSDCYWARLSGLSGDFDDVITNGLGAHQVVTISPSDAAFDTERCGEWTKVG